MMYPLSCLENETNLTEKIKLNRTQSNLDLINDSGWQVYLQREDCKLWLS